VSAVTTLLTPWLIRAAAPAATFVDHKLPEALQTFVALYGSWIERLRQSEDRGPNTEAAAVRRLAWLMLVDGVALAAILIGASLSVGRLAPWLQQKIHLDRAVARTAVLIAAGLLSLPFLVGVVRVARRMGVTLAAIAFPPGASAGVDLAAAPRRALEVTLQLAGVLVVGVPILAVTQPFLRGIETAATMALLVLLLGIAFWRSATNLQGHVRAGVQVIVESLGKQLQDENAHGTADASAPHDFDRMLPGLGAPLPVRLKENSPAVGRTLAQMNLRAITGATVLAIVRQGRGLVPSAEGALHAGDVLALAGTHDALDSARQILGAEAATSDGEDAIP
jgi:monovalent cation:H+ antiporter-2, CPA2 family